MEVSEPSAAFPDSGLFDVGIEFSPSCNLKLDDRKLLEYGSQIAQQLQSFIVNSNTFNMKELCIISGKFCWNICVDLLVLQMDGDPLDACSIATYVALNSTKIPKVDVFLGESGMPEDFEVNGDLGESTLLKAKELPICVSSSKVPTLSAEPATELLICCLKYLTFYIVLSCHEDRKVSCAGCHRDRAGLLL